MKKLMILLLVLWGCISTASAYPQNKQSASWGYQPIYTTQQTPIAGTPTYQFRSTSAYIATKANASGGWSTYNAGLRTLDSDPTVNEEEEDEIGVIPDIPVGSPLVLLAFAALYILYRIRKKRNLSHLLKQ